MKVTSAALFKDLGHVIEDGFDRLKLDVREDRLLQLDASDLQPVLVG